MPRGSMPVDATGGCSGLRTNPSRPIPLRPFPVHRLDDLLTQVAHQQMERLPPDFEYRLSVAYFPQIGYLIVVPMEYFHANNNDPSIPGLTFHVRIAPLSALNHGPGH